MVRSVPVSQLASTMRDPERIRNVSIIAHVDHGKSTLADCLLHKSGLLRQVGSGQRALDTTKEEQDRGITIKSAAVSMLFATGDEREYLVNLIDSPGHVDFSSEVSAALRLCDGALVVVDCVEGCRVQTQTVIRQAVAEGVRPVLVLNKVDRAIEELCLEPEEAYQRFCETIDRANMLATATATSESETEMPFRPEAGTVAFGSGLVGWGFTLDTFADIYAAKLGVAKDKLRKRLWGDHFFDPEAKKWYTSKTSPVTGKPLERGFVRFVLRPIYEILRVLKIADDAERTAKIVAMLARVGTTVKPTQLDHPAGSRRLATAAMAAFLPFADALVEMIAARLPSPRAAQAYRVDSLYTGPLDDAVATSIRQCDARGPLVVFVSKMVPVDQTNPGAGFYAFGRVFSGTVRAGQAVRIMGPNHVVGTTIDLVPKASVRATQVLMVKQVHGLDECPSGNIVALSGLDRHMVKGGTITDTAETCPIRTMKFSVSPVVRTAVKPKRVAELPKLVAALRNLARVDPLVEVHTEESGEMTVAAAGELHLEVTIKQLQELAKIEITHSDPVVNYRETVVGDTLNAGAPFLTKSANRHNRFHMAAEPLGAALVDELEAGVVDPTRDRVPLPGGGEVARYRYLADQHGWAATEARKIWAFGPEGGATNVLVDLTSAVPNMNEVRDAASAAFQWALGDGPLCGETMRGIRFNILDATLHADAIHRGAGQLMPCIRRAMYGSMLQASPRLVEPVFLTTITVSSQSAVGSVYSVLSRRRGRVISETMDASGYVIEGYLPVGESLGFNADLRGATGGEAAPQCAFDHWETMVADPADPESKAALLVAAIRERKGLAPVYPPAESYGDR